MADENLPEFPGEGRRFEDGEFQAPTIDHAGFVPEVVPLPDLAEMVNLSNAELWELMQRYGVADNWPDLVAQAQKYNEQFSRISPVADPAAFQAQVDALLDLEPRTDGKPSRGMLSLARRTQERYTTLEALDGNPAQELIRISEGDANVCPGCSEMAGEIGTYHEHMAKGLPGDQQCGGRCRCQLIAID